MRGCAEEAHAAQVGHERGNFRLGNGQFGGGVDDPFKVCGTDGVEVGIGHRIHEIDGKGDAVFDGEFDGVDVVSQGLTEANGVLLDAFEEAFGGCWLILKVSLGVGFARIVGHDAHLLLPDDVAAEVFAEVDGLLVHHAELVGAVVGLEELVARVDGMDVAPTASVDWLEKSMLADGGEDGVPVERILEVAQAAIIHSWGWILVR